MTTHPAEMLEALERRAATLRRQAADRSRQREGDRPLLILIVSPDVS